MDVVVLSLSGFVHSLDTFFSAIYYNATLVKFLKIAKLQFVIPPPFH